MKISFKETINWLRKRYEYSKNEPWAIEFDENEAKISRMGKLDSSIKWEEVERIRAFKNDRFAYDPIVIVLETQDESISCLLYTSPSPRDLSTSRMPSSA